MMNQIRTAEILCVGTELLLGDIINTNASSLSRRLSALGICVYHHSVVGDHAGRLMDALTLALSRADLLILSGGLGPTYDDMTKETVAAYFHLPMVRDEATLAYIRDYFARTGRVMTPNNEKQADYPRGAKLLFNDRGTAPGILLEAKDKTVVLLPGPPHELEPMFDKRVMPYLRTRTDGILVSRNLYIYGMGESAVEQVLRPMMVDAVNPTVAPYCKPGEVRLRVTAKADGEAEAEALCKKTVAAIRASSIGDKIYAECDSRDGEVTMEAEAIKALLSAGKTVACAESCTGGLIAKRLTDVPGSSAAVLGGCVTYTNEMKQLLLGVHAETLEKYTAVSEAVAAEMADGIRTRTNADIGVSATGYAGPGGGTEQDPVGTVYVGLSTADKTTVSRLTLSPGRTRDYIRTLASLHALYLIRTAALL